MDFWDITKVLFRRWYVAVPLLVVTAAAAVSVGIVEKPLYQLTAYVQLVPAPDIAGASTKLTPVNPWNQTGLDSLSTAAQLGTQDQTFLDTLTSEGKTSNFTIDVGDPPSGDTFEIIGTSEKQVQDTADLVLTRFSQYIKSLQAAYGVPDTEMISTQRLDRGANITRPNGKQLRAVIAVVGAGVIITCACAIFADYQSRRRAGRRSRRTSRKASGNGPVLAPRQPVAALVSASAQSAGGGSGRGGAQMGDPPDGAAIMTHADVSDGSGEDIR